MTESFEVGTYYMEANNTRVTDIDACGYSISIRENYWGDNESWAVSVDHSLDESYELCDVLSHIERLRVTCGVLIAIGYDYYGMVDDSTSLWEKR